MTRVDDRGLQRKTIHLFKMWSNLHFSVTLINMCNKITKFLENMFFLIRNLQLFTNSKRTSQCTSKIQDGDHQIRQMYLRQRQLVTHYHFSGSQVMGRHNWVHQKQAHFKQDKTIWFSIFVMNGLVVHFRAAVITIEIIYCIDLRINFYIARSPITHSLDISQLEAYSLS